MFESQNMDLRLLSLILLNISVSLTLDHLTVTCENVCALRETNVQLKCFHSGDINITTVFWFSQKQSTNWRNNNEPEDLTLDSDYSGRVKTLMSNNYSTLIISDVREHDSGEYQLMFIMKDGVKHLCSNSVNLTVTDLQVKVNPASTDQRDHGLNLTCETSCDLTFAPQNYFWKKNGQYIKDLHFRSISVPPNETDNNYACFLTPDLKNSSSPVCLSKSGCWDVTYTSRRVCALTGSTVDISSTYSLPSNYSVNKTFWHYVQPGVFMDLREQHRFAGRVEYVENKLRIKELKISDSGEYQFRIISNTTGGTYSGSPGVILTVTDTHVKSSPDMISGGEKVILSCLTECTLSDKHTYIWFKNGRQVTDGFTKANKLYLDSVSNEELQEFSCAVGEIQIPPNPESNAVLKSSLIILSVFVIFTLLGVLLYRRRRNKSSQQHEDMKEAVQSGSSAVYDNFAPLSTVCKQLEHKQDQDVHYLSINFKQSHTNNTSVYSDSDNVHYATVKFR